MTVSRRKAAGEAQGVTHVPPRPDISRAARSARSGQWRFGFWILHYSQTGTSPKGTHDVPHAHLSIHIASGSGRLTARRPPKQTRTTAPLAPADRTSGRSPAVGGESLGQHSGVAQEGLPLGVGGLRGGRMVLLYAGKHYMQDSPTIPLKDVPYEMTTWGDWVSRHPTSRIYLGS
jgi:hypothetical protein